MDPSSDPTPPLAETEAAPADAASAPAPEPVSAGQVQAKTRASSWVNVALGGAVLVGVAGASFSAGRLTAPTAATSGLDGRGGAGAGPGSGNLPGNGGFQGGGQFGGPGGDRGGAGAGPSITGTVASLDGGTLTLRLADGRTIAIRLSDATTYHAQAAASSADVTAGRTVIVRVGDFRPDGAGSGVGPTAADVTVVP